MATRSLHDLDRSLQQQRSALAQTADALRQRVRRELRGLAPRRQLRRHATAAAATTAVCGFVAGRILGRLLAALL